jgi:hypothetical protein
MKDLPVDTEGHRGIAEIHILWLTAGLSCDGETIAMTAATQPSLHDLLFGGLPGIPKVSFHNPVLAFENGDEFLKPFHEAARGLLSPFLLVVEGSIPNEANRRKVIGLRLGRTKRQVNRSLLAIGLIGWHGKHGQSLPLVRVRPMVGFTRWKGIRPDAWASRITWGGGGSPRRGSRSCVFRDARRNPTISWKRYCICFISPRDALP